MEIVGRGIRKKVGIGIFVLGGLVYLCFLILPHDGQAIAEAKEIALQENLRQMRLLIRDYTAELHKRPESLHDLVAAGYMKKLPMDPMTDRRDTWTVEWSSDQATPGIVNVHSGASTVSSKGSRYAEW